MAVALLARHRRRVLAASTLGVVAGMLAVGGALTISRNGYLDAVPRGPLRRDTVRAAYDIVSGSLSNRTRVVLLVALAVMVIAWLMGTSDLAVSLRRTVRGMPSAVINPGRHAVEHAAQLSLTGVGAAAVVLVCWTRPTLAVVVTVAAVTIGALLRPLASQPRQPAERPQAARNRV